MKTFQSALFTGIIIISFANVHAEWSARMGLEGGLVAAELSGPAFGYGLHADIGYKLNEFGWLDYYPSADFWMKTQRNTSSHKMDRRMEIGLNLADIRYYPPVPENIRARPYIGFGGIGVLHIRSTISLSDENKRETEMKFGADFLGGCDVIIKPHLRVFAEMKGKSAGLAAFKLYAGVSYEPAKKAAATSAK